jgi:hypothetical protein
VSKARQLTLERHRHLLAYASVDFSGVGKQRYEEPAFYNNHRFKRKQTEGLKMKATTRNSKASVT